MNIEQRVQFIRRNLEMGGYTIAARECVSIIEHALRELFLRHLTRLDEKDRIRVQELELKFGKGKGVESFTMGQLVGLFRQSKFLDAWARSTGRELINIRMINLDEITSNRNKLMHDGKEATRSEAEFLLFCLRLILETFGIESLEDETMRPDVSDSAASVEPPGTDLPPNPYRGLHAFREEDAPYFFGREKVVERLKTVFGTERFVSVIGASGSGKSSLVLAGLTPALRQDDAWLIADFRPRNQPFVELALALLPLFCQDKIEQAGKLKSLSHDLETGGVEIPHLMQLVRRDFPGKRLLVIADQFEELYTLNPDRDLRIRFIDCLLRGIQTPGFRLLLTLRADFMGQAIGYGPFAAAVNSGHKEILGRMDEPEIMAAIEKPAEKLGVSFEPGLSRRVFQDVGNEPGSLPLLEFALTQIWDRQSGNLITHAAYDDIGGVKQALARHADAVCSRFSPEGRENLRKIFIQLVRPGEGTEDTRQVASREQFTRENWKLITQMLATERLVVTGQNEETGRETVEVVHEALIRNWEPLRKWMDEDRGFRVWQNNLRQAMQTWEQTGKDAGALLRGVRLGEAEEKLSERPDEISDREIEFIRAGIALREKEIQEKEQAQKRIRRIVIAAFLLVLLAVACWAARELVQGVELDLRNRALQISKRELEKSLKETEVAKRQTEEALAEARSNLGFVFYEKAENEFDKKNVGAASVYITHSLACLDPNFPGVEKARGLASVLYAYECPMLFSSPLHDSYVSSVSFSTDGRTLASGSGDSTIRLWDVASGKEKGLLTGHLLPVTSVCFSPDGKTLASGSVDLTIRLWDVETDKEERILIGHTSYVSNVSFSPDGRTLASGSKDKTVRLWDVETGEQKGRLTGHNFPVLCVIFSPDGTLLASGDVKKVILWDVSEREKIAKLTGPPHSACSLSFSPDGKTLASPGAFEKAIRIWDVETGKEKSVLAGHTASIFNVDFSPDGKTLASSSVDKSIILWDVETGEKKAMLIGHTSDVYSVGFSPDGKTLASGSEDKTIRLWDVETGKKTAPLANNNNSIENIMFSPAGSILAFALKDKTIRLWDIETRKEVIVLRGHTDSIKSVTFSSDGRTLASGSPDKTILWGVETGKEMAILTGQKDFVNCVSFSPDGGILASGTKDIRLWDIETGREKALLTGHTKSVDSLAFSPDGRTLASGSRDKTIRIWDVETGKEQERFTGHGDRIYSVSFSPDGKSLASGSRDKTICLWDVTTGEKLKEIADIFMVTSIIFSPDGKTLASASGSVGGGNRSIHLWDVKTGKQKGILNGHTDNVTSLSISPDGRTLASGSHDRTIRLWDLSFFDQYEDRQLTEAEVQAVEQTYNLKLVNLELQPIEQNISGTKPEPPKWPKTHPFHWLRKAENGDTKAMVELGIIYDRDNDLNKAWKWYNRALEAGSERARERLKIFKKWLTLHKDEYPKAYGKYCE